MSVSVRIASLSLGGSGSKTLGAMEAHGKRQDSTSQHRRVRDREALVYGSLNLREAYDQHVEGCRTNKGLKRPVLHALVQFPTKTKITPTNEKKMLQAAVAFINESHGGDAVFAARLDRDEAGQHTVDVFFSPKYEKVTKSRGSEMWISTSKHGKEICQKHKEEIERRHGGKFLTGPRQVGIAINSEWRAFLGRYGVDLAPKQEKENSRPDRVEPEAFKAQRDIENAKRARKVIQKEKAELAAEREKIAQDAAEVLRSNLIVTKAARELEQAVKTAERRVPSSLSDRVKGVLLSAFDTVKNALSGLLPELSQVSEKMMDMIPDEPEHSDEHSGLKM
jgi:hypothetical protein